MEDTVEQELKIQKLSYEFSQKLSEIEWMSSVGIEFEINY